MQPNPRATTYVSTTKDEENAAKIVNEIRQMESPTLHWVLCKFLECPILKDEPQFVQVIFEDHIHLVMEMVEWMLTPKLIARRKKIKSSLDFFPFRCKEFIKDNIPFYEQLYLYARAGKLPINIWFNFLRKECADQETILTALGYFAEVMIPFAKYEFSASSSLTSSMQLNAGLDKTQTLSIMKILPKQLIEQLIGHSHYEPIFQFIKISILVSIQDPADYEISKTTMLQLLKSSHTENIFDKANSFFPQRVEQFQNKVDVLENVSLSLKELVANIDPGNDMQLRIQSLIFIILESGTIPYVIDEILKSKFCEVGSQREQSSTGSMVNLSASMEFPTQSATNLTNALSLSHKPSTGSPKNTISPFAEPEEQDLMEILLKILTYSVEIFIKIPKVVPTIKKTTDEIDLYQVRQVNYRLLISKFREQMQKLLFSLETMTRIVYIQGQLGLNTKPIPFSSGQKIKPVTFMRFQYLKLMEKCLKMLQYKESSDSPDKLGENKPLKKFNSISLAPFEVDFEKLHCISIIQKYLNENRWNNIVHQLLENICHSLIVCSYEYLRKNIEKDKNKKVTQSFLAFLIENFTQRDYIFLNTLKFTTQGNLQAIYNISKDLAYTLNSTNQLVILLNEFEPWKKFIMKDLKLYEEKTYPVSIKPEGADVDEEVSYKDMPGLKVDEADSIRKLIENISSTPKWPTKISRYKGNSKSGILVQQRNSNEFRQVDSPTLMSKSQGFYLQNNKQRRQNKKNNLINYAKKVQESIQFEQEYQINELSLISKSSGEQKATKSDIKGESHDKGQMYDIFKNYATSFKIDKDKKKQ